MPAQNMLAAEVDVDERLVRGLLADQHPDLAELALEPLAFGWDNAILRLGADLVVRLPRRELAAVLVEHEQRWLPQLAAHLPLPIPVPVRVGVPNEAYPWAWSVCPWLPGRPAIADPPAGHTAAAAALGGFVTAMHRDAPEDAPANPYRGVPLAARAEVFHDRVDQLGSLIDGEAVRACWEEAVSVPPWSRPPVWLHGDLHPANLLVDGGRLSAVIDFGDLTAGDPATDLAVAWMMFPAELRGVLRTAAGDVDDHTWARARGWALALGLAFLANSADNPPFEELGHRTIAAAVSD